MNKLPKRWKSRRNGTNWEIEIVRDDGLIILHRVPDRGWLNDTRYTSERALRENYTEDKSHDKKSKN